MYVDKLINIELQIVIFFLIGISLKKLNIITKENDRFLSLLILNVIMPTNIFLCFFSSVSLNVAISLLPLILVGVFVVIAIQLFSKLNPLRLDKEKRKIAEYGMLISNGSLVGLPIIENLFGSIGIVYANIFMIPTRILAFSFAEKYFNPHYQNLGLKVIIKTFLTNPITIAMILGFLLNVTSITLTPAISASVASLSACMTPLALILVGSTLADIKDFKIFLNHDLWEMSIFRLFVSPLITFLIAYLLHLPNEVIMTATIINATPVASTATIFCKKYDGDLNYTSGCIFLSTVLAAVSLFIVCSALTNLFV